MDLFGGPLSLDDVAAEVGVHYQTVYRWVRAGKLPADMVHGRYRVMRHDLVAFIDARLTPTRPRPAGARDLARVLVAEHTNNWWVHQLGANVSTDELVRFCDEHEIDVAVLNFADSVCVDLAETTAARIRKSGTRAVVGGPGRTAQDLVQIARDAALDKG